MYLRESTKGDRNWIAASTLIISYRKELENELLVYFVESDVMVDRQVLDQIFSTYPRLIIHKRISNPK